MKMRYIQTVLALAFTAFVFSSCSKWDVAPRDQISTESIAETEDGIINVTNGNYALFKNQVVFNGFIDDNNGYLRQYFQMSDFASDDIVCGQVTTDPLYYSFTYTHSPDQSNSRFFWYVSYKMINGANTVIDIVENSGKIEHTQMVNQILGENYFLRAFVEFNLLRFYANLPTVGNPESDPGIILRLSPNEPSKKARATVKESYEQVLADAKKAASLMTMDRGREFASKEAAWALLSRVYLYLEDNDKTIAYADSVINSGKYQLETADSYPSYFPNAISRNETIFLIAYTQQDNRGKFGSIASMIYSDGNSGWGEEFASKSLRDVMAEHLEDVRWKYIDTLFKDDGSIATKNGIEVFYITKFSFQDGDPNLSSPVMFRLAEMYLNRAEGYAKKGNVNAALNDVNEIRKHRGLEGSLYSSVPAGQTILDVVLKERRIELAFEGHRTADLVRNHRDIVRNYWGYHIKGLQVPDIDPNNPPSGYPELLIKWNDPSILYYIPTDEILANDLCVQNP
jgi:tetratricopeptide (TPR) repeat protein